MKRTVAVVTLLFALSFLALAHGNEKHIMGAVSSAAAVEIAGMGEVLSLLGWGPEELWQSAGRAA